MTDCSTLDRPWSELTTDELYAFLKLRTDVFFVEQKVDETELDDRDREASTRHYWISDEVGTAAYLRTLVDAEPTHLDAARLIGRVVVRADPARPGLAQKLIAEVLARHGDEAMLLHAQHYIAPLYAQFGFVAFGDVYEEAGIEHLSMYRPAWMNAAEEFATTADWYRRFAEIEAPGRSALFEEWAHGVAEDATILELLAELPRPKRQPNLLFACSRLVGCPLVAYAQWREWLLDHWADVRAEMLVRATQTNEPRRCAVLLPLLAQVDGTIALLEVGASAGLCLYPDRYSYSYDGRRLDPPTGPSTVLLECATTGDPPIPNRMPQIVWRAGLDLNPLDLGDAGDTLWLETLVWPEQHERRARIRSASEIVRADPPRIERGDAIDDLPALVAQAPSEASLVIVTSAAIVYLMPEPRARFIEYVRSLDATWISNEGAGIVPVAAAALDGRQPPVPGQLLLSMDEKPLAFTGPHGDRLDWL